VLSLDRLRLTMLGFRARCLFGLLARAMTTNAIFQISVSDIISPTHKRTEGHAPVWGSEFTLKDAALQGGSTKLLLG
jgi:hypothetical protein